MIKLKSRFKTERSPHTSVEEIALRIVQDVTEMTRDIATDIESAYVEDIHTCLDFLNTRISSADAGRVVAICADVPARLERLRHYTVAATIREMLEELKNWPPDEELGPEMTFGESEPLDEFEVVGSAVSVPGHFEIKGRFLRLDRGTLGAFGLKGSSHFGKTVYFNAHFSKVRKVIRRQS